MKRMKRMLKEFAHLLLIIILSLNCFKSISQDTVSYEYKVPRIDEWQLKPITNYPCLIIKAEDKERLAANVKLFRPEIVKEIEPFAKCWLYQGDSLQQITVTKSFIKYWKNYNQRWQPKNLQCDMPDGVGLRGIGRSIQYYDLIQSFGKLSEADRLEFRDSVVKSIELAIGKDCQHPKITPVLAFRHMNIWADVVCAAGITGLAFPELPQSKHWVQFAMDEINWQLTVGEWDGCWHESTRYHMAMLAICGQFFEMLNNRTGIDMFQHPSLKRMIYWPVEVSTPKTVVPQLKYAVPGGISLMPPIGGCWRPELYGLLNFYARHYVKTDPQFAAHLIWQWEHSGKTFDGCNIATMLLVDPTLKSIVPNLKSTIKYKKGYLVMRDKFNTPDEVWFFQKSGGTSFGSHETSNRNSFSLFADGYPLALDAGSGNYSDRRMNTWYRKTVASNAVVFEDPKFPNDIYHVKTQSIVNGKILTWKSNDEADFSCTDASDASKVEKNVRSVLFVKPDYFVIKDDIKSKFNSDWLLHTTAQHFNWKDQSVNCETPWGIDLDLYVLSPERKIDTTLYEGSIGDWMDAKAKDSIGIVKGNASKATTNDFFPFRYQKFMTISGKPNEGFLMLLHPHRKNTKTFSYKKISETKIEVQNGSRKDVIEFIDGGVKLTKGGKEISFK